MSVTGQPTVAYSYDNANRLTRIVKSGATVAITYDAAGRRTAVTLPNGVLTTYTYDSASRLTRIVYSRGNTVLGDLTYTYDAASNRTQVGGSFARTGLPQPIASAVYDAANQLTRFGSQTLSYDRNGNLTSDGTRAFSWNARNRLARINVGGRTTSFKYDGFGRRIAKSSGKTNTGFV